VFLGSLMDIFEQHPQLEHWRTDVWKVLRELTSLTFLLLTKRPENIASMLPADLQGASHLWLGTTVESQAYLHRLDNLCAVPAVVHFVSAEPQLEAIDFRPWFEKDRFAGGPVNWIITGGESKQKKDSIPRPYNLAWTLDLIDQGAEYGVPVFVKQLGSRPIGTTDWQRRACQAIRHRKGENPDEWSPELRVRQFPQPSGHLALSSQV
jgi:protein gp37